MKRRSLIAGDQPGTADPYTRLCLRSDPVKITRGFSRSTFKDVNQYDGVRSERCARPFITPTTGDTGRVSGYEYGVVLLSQQRFKAHQPNNKLIRVGLFEQTGSCYLPSPA